MLTTDEEQKPIEYPVEVKAILEDTDESKPMKDIQSHTKLILDVSLPSLCYYRMNPKECAKSKDWVHKFLGYFWKLL